MITIKSISGRIIHHSEKTTLREALIEAIAAGADLRGADLRGAVLRDEDLRGVDLSGVVLRGVEGFIDLSGADLRGADLSGVDLSGVVLSGAVGFAAESVACEQSSVPVIQNIHRAVLAAATAEGCNLDMSRWHTCETTHCRAGWVVHLAGEAGRNLENEIGTAAAAMQIYLASDPGYADHAIRLPRWYCSNEEAIADMRACAEREAAAEAAANQTKE